MPAWIRTSLFSLLAIFPPAIGLALPAGIFQVVIERLPDDMEVTEEDERCGEAINDQVWDQVIAICEPLVAEYDESHPSWETYKQNVDYAYQTKCVAAAQASDWDTTLATCVPTLQAFPDSFTVHLFLGLAHQAKEDLTLANTSFEAFLAGAAANPQMAPQLGQQVALARRSAAINHLMLGNRMAAIPLLREVAASDPNDAEIHFRLGFALLQEKDTAGAEEAFAVVIALDPDIPQLPQVLFLAGQIAYNAQEFEQAGERLSRYLEREPEGEHATDSHWMLAFIAGRNEDQDQMASHYRAALEAAPDDPRARDANYSLGVIAFNRNQCNTAQRYFNRFMRLARNDPRRAEVDDMLLDIEDGVCEPGC